MKFIGILITLFVHLHCFSQKTSSDLTGTWQIKKVVNNTKSSVNCTGITDYTITFKSDNTYSFIGGGPEYITTGQWKIEGTKIHFYNSKLADPSMGTVGDHTDPFEINSEGVLIIEEYMCSELGGKTYYKKIK